MKLLNYSLALLLSGLSMMLYSQREYKDGIDGIPFNPHPKIYTISTNHNNVIVSGEYMTILGKNHVQIKKPFIFIEGIDILGNTEFSSHIKLLNNNHLIKRLHDNGYDVIILDFDNSKRIIQENAMLLIQLINNLYAENALTEDNFVVMGFSMGGLVARYALTWMEANNQNHHTRLYISHDAPHKGANLPLGLQELIQDLKTKGGGIPSIVTSLFFPILVNDFPATSQMLIYHFINSKNGIAKPSDESISFFSELYNLSPTTNGYPAIPLKIATSNGNFVGNLQINNTTGDILKPGEDILSFNYTKDNGLGPQVCNLLQLIFNTCPPAKPLAPDVIKATVRAGFDEGKPLDEFHIYSRGKYPIGNTGKKILLIGSGGEQTFLSRNISYDNASGSFSKYYMEAIQDGIEKALGTTVHAITSTCFIPTVSALDLNIGINNPFNLNNSHCYTNFDHIFADKQFNFDHFSLQSDATNFIMTHILSNNQPIKKTYYSAENITLPANQIINNNENFNANAKYLIRNDHGFTLEAGASSSLVAGQSIVLKAGFWAKSGCAFSAKTGFMCENPIEFNPRHLAKGLVPNSNTSIQYDYDCNNFDDMPNYNAEYKYFDCDTIITNDYYTEIDSVLNSKINVYPIPTYGEMNIQLDQDIPIDILTIQIYDYMSNLIYTISPVNSRVINFNIPNCLPGLLTVKFTFSNPLYIFNKKILKQ